MPDRLETPQPAAASRLGLRGILYLAFPAGLALTLLFLGFALTRSVQHALQGGLSARGQAILHNLAARSVLPLVRQKPPLAEVVFDDVFDDPEVDFAALVLPDGRPLASRARANVPAGRVAALRQRFARPEEDGQSFSALGTLCLSQRVTTADLMEKSDTRSAEEEHLLMGGAEATPQPAARSASGTARGTVYLGLSERSIDDQLRSLRAEVALSLLLGIVLFSATVFWILRRFVLRPLADMTQMALRVSEYDLGSGAPPLPAGRDVSPAPAEGDEFGRLTDALGRIVRNLSLTLSRTRGVTQAVAQVIEQIGRSSDSVAHGAQTTFASVDETSSSMAEVLTSLRGIGRSVEVLDQSAEASATDIAQMARLSELVVANIQELAQSVEETSASIEQMTFSIKDVAVNVEDLSQSAVGTVSAMNEMDLAITRVEVNADETEQLSAQVQADAETGVLALQKTLLGIDNIKEAASAAGQVFVSLRQKILSIGDTLTVIDSVAEQTNLLALNAAIIAAQAGEQGRGFAVVADEIKDLADRTGVSTREIAQVVHGIQDEARASVAAMRRGNESIEAGVLLGREAETALKKIDASARRQAERVREIAHATVEQSRQSKQVAVSLTRMAQTAQQIAKATSDQARGSEQIMRSAERMRSVTHAAEASIAEESLGSRRVIVSMGRIGAMVKELRRSQEAQSQGAEQVMGAVENIKRVAEAQNQSTRELEQAIEELRGQADVLQREVLRFKV